MEILFRNYTHPLNNLLEYRESEFRVHQKIARIKKKLNKFKFPSDEVFLSDTYDEVWDKILNDDEEFIHYFFKCLNYAESIDPDFMYLFEDLQGVDEYALYDPSNKEFVQNIISPYRNVMRLLILKSKGFFKSEGADDTKFSHY